MARSNGEMNRKRHGCADGDGDNEEESDGEERHSSSCAETEFGSVKGEGH